MKKIISLFQRNYGGDNLVRDEIVPGAEWVTRGEGVATRKFDGTCCLIKDGSLFRRYDAKRGKKPPEGFVPAQDPDPVTGHWPGWVKCRAENPSDKYHFEAFYLNTNRVDGTYELIGPMVQGNPEKREAHVLVRHRSHELDAPRSYNELREWLKDREIEGIVWHHPDGRMVKIKRRDFWR